jgi:choline transport protein
VPLSNLYGLMLNCATALGFMVWVQYCLAETETALATPTGYPIMQVIFSAINSKAATNVFMAFINFNGIIARSSSLAFLSQG